jgi:ABC-2 type transport system ATP-binding protein
VQGPEKSYKRPHILRGVDGAGWHLRPSRLERDGQDHGREHPVHAAQGGRGAASVNGFDVAGQAPDVRESISFTGQFAAVDKVLSGRESLVLVARLRHLKDPGTIADDLLDRLALTDAAARKVSTYSGGMRRIPTQ